MTHNPKTELEAGVTILDPALTPHGSVMTSLNSLSRWRANLTLQGRFKEAISAQLEILELLQQRVGEIRDISNAWNMLSHLYHLNHQLDEAADAARNALRTYAADIQPRLETLATYEMKLATILADQRCFDEAVQYGRSALEHFSYFHRPPDDFLIQRQFDVAQMVNSRDQATKQMYESGDPQ